MIIGIAGTGRMGTAIGQRLISTGATVVAWNRTAGRTAALAEAGAEVVGKAVDLTARADVIITSLTDAEAVREVYRGSRGLLAGPAGGKLFIEMSTIRPAVAVEMCEAVRAAGAAFVECPVGGTTGPARDGKLVGLAGGAAEDVERAMPVLSALCRRVDAVGPVGAGAAMKLAINLPLVVFWEAFGEALALCRSAGLPGDRLVDLFADTSGGPNVLRSRAAAVAAALDGTAPAGTYDVDSMRKDLRAMLDEAADLGAELPVAAAALGRADACAAAGQGDRDGVAISLLARGGRG